MTGLDVAALRRAAAARQDTIGPCNRRCRERGECAFGRSDPPGSYCRERRPPRRGEREADRSPDPGGGQHGETLADGAGGAAG